MEGGCNVTKALSSLFYPLFFATNCVFITLLSSFCSCSVKALCESFVDVRLSF